MSRIQRFWASSIGGKLTMAVTGLLLFGFAVGHMSGNLAVFSGRDAMNSYAEFLHSMPKLLWVVRLGLLAVALAHIVTAIKQARENRKARPVPYAKNSPLVSTAASRSMVLTGVTIAFYVLFHLAHLTWRWFPESTSGLVETLADGSTRTDVYGMVVLGFQQWYLSALYFLAMVALFFHLRHGIASFFQTIGFHHERYLGCLRCISTTLAAVIFLGYVSIPVACLAGWVTNGGA